MRINKITIGKNITIKLEYNGANLAMIFRDKDDIKDFIQRRPKDELEELTQAALREFQKQDITLNDVRILENKEIIIIKTVDIK